VYKRQAEAGDIFDDKDAHGLPFDRNAGGCVGRRRRVGVRREKEPLRI